MSTGTRPMSWRLRLLALLMVLLTMAVWGTFWLQLERSHALMRQQALAQADERSRQLADAMAGQVTGLLAGIDLALLQLRREWNTNRRNFDATAHDMLEALPPGAVSHVTVVGADGYVVYNSLGIEARTYVGDRPHFQAQRDSGADRLMVGRPVMSKLGRTWTFIVSRPLLRDGRFAGVMNMSVSSAYLSEKLAGLHLSEQDIIALLYRDGSVMARSMDFHQAMGESVLPDQPFLAPGASQAGVFHTSGPLARIHAWHRLPEHGLIVVIGLTQKAVLAALDERVDRDRKTSLVLVSLVALFGAFITLLLLKSARKQEALAVSEAFRKQVFESSPIPIVVMDSRTLACIDCNPAAVAVFRFGSREEMLATTPMVVSPLLQRDGTPTSELVGKNTAKALSEGYAQFEWCFRRPGGELWDAEVHLMAFWSGDKQLIHVTLQDITEQKRAEHALRESEERYRIQVEHAPEAVMVFDVDRGKFVEANENALRMFGMTREAFQHHAPEDLSPPYQPDGRASADLVPIKLRETLEGGAPVFEWVHRDVAGEDIPCEVRLVRMPSTGHNLVRASITDISERKRAEAALRKSEERYTLAAQIGHSGAWELWPVEGRIFFDANLTHLLGYEEDELSDALPDWMEHVPEYARAEVEKAIQSVIEGRSDNFTLEHPVRRKDGSTGWVYVKGQRISAPGETPLRLVGSTLDITERKQVEEALELTQYAVDNSQDGVFWVDPQGRVVKVNDRACLSLGYSRDALIGQHLWEFDPLFKPEDWIPLFERMRREGSVVFESLHRKRDGTTFPVEITASYIRYGDREYGFSFARDITERKQVEAALRLTQFSLDHAPDGVFWVKQDGSVEYVNEEACRSLGYTRDELRGMRVWEFDPDFPPEKWPRQWASLSQTHVRRTFETRHRSKDGGIHPVEISAVYTAYGDREYHSAFVRDISQRKLDEATLKQDQEQQTVLREMMEQTVSGGSMRQTLETCLIRLLRISWLSLLPQGGIFLMGEDGQSLELTVSHGLAPEILGLCDRVSLGQCLCGRAAESARMQFAHCVDHRHDIRYPDMSEHGHYNLPLISEGAVLGVIVLYLPKDFTRDEAKEQFLTTVADMLAGYIRRKRAEDDLKRLNEQLEDRVEQRTVELVEARDEAERASRAKSEFLSRMSHELRTPLNAILGFGQLLEMDLREGEQGDSVREILHAGRHLLELINEVLDLARIESGRLTISREPVLLIPLIEECLTLIGPLAGKLGIQIASPGQDCGELVQADRTRLKQVLINLLSNAVKYNKPGGRIDIDCLRDGHSMQIRISDTGGGLTPEQQVRLFAPFERLDADRLAIEGTGIGLALSKRLTELMEGEIGVESTPGLGSTFWVRLPLAADHGYAACGETGMCPPGLDNLPAPPVDRLWRVLCIEDNPANLRLVERILSRRQDIRLETVDTPSRGLERIREQPPAVILLDINLPEMDGYEVMQCLREDPATRTIPVVAISANAMPGDLARGKAAGFVQYLTKPLEVDQLLQALDDIIAGLSDRPSGMDDPRRTHGSPPTGW